MNTKTNPYICFGLIEIVLLAISFIPQPVLAACVDADISFQAAAYFSNQPTPIQSNNVQSQTTDNCFNQSAATSNVQVYSGNGQITQKRQRNIVQDTPFNPLEGMGIDTPNVETHIDRSLAIPLPFDTIAP